MASISNDGAGRRIQFVAPDGKRKAIRLGKVTRREAETVKTYLERVVNALTMNVPVDPETARWVAGVGDELAAKLAAVGLVPERASMTLGAFIDSFIAGRGDVKEGTLTNFRISKSRLMAYVKEGMGKDDVNLRDFTEADADGLKVHLNKKYAPATVSRTVKRARQFFKAAVRRRLITGNPFSEVMAGAQANGARRFFVTREMAAKVLDACTDNEWRLIFALSRFAGLRCPSEHVNLRWEDVDRERSKMLIRSPKKERLECGGERWVPVFPEVRPYLDQAFDDAEEGAVFVVTRYRDAGVNLRSRMLKTIKRAGLKPWPRLFHNLRASCETELAKDYPLHVVCEWVGNSAKVAADHYLQVTDADFERGARDGAPAAQKAAQPAADKVCQPLIAPPEPFTASDVMQPLSKGSNDWQCTPVTPRGLEPLS